MNDALTDLVRDINMLRNQVVGFDTIIGSVGHDVSQSQIPRFNLIGVLIEIGTQSIGCRVTIGIIKPTKVVPCSTFEQRKNYLDFLG